MILTITMNPSIDISYPLEKFNLNTVNRISEPLKTPGGKGLNVTRILKQIGNDVLASGLIGGFSGKDIQSRLNSKKIKHSFFEISGETRNCIAILHEGNQTEILESGPTVTSGESDGFLKHLKKLLSEISVVTISGSLPKGIEKDFYTKIIKICNEYNKSTILDCSGEALTSVLKSPYKPKVIKPNAEELSLLVNKKISQNSVELKNILSNSFFSGIEWIIVSLGKNGCFARHHDKFYKVNIPQIKAVNPVGSGDATVAGIASALETGKNDRELLKIGNTLGILNAMEKMTGYVDIEKYDDVFNNIQISEI
ncbi:MAG: tagatose-6-phosphate kinase [Leptotrichiaceae bacterium]|nr:tagatose-6-phosphate kinase [Leptotrichiaceae bacterium]